MENFILYNVAAEGREVSFEASWVHVQRIAKGTDEMVGEMLQDVGVRDRKIESWTLRHFLSNYLSDDPRSDDWSEVWIDTVEVVAKLDGAAKVEPGETDLVRTFARDKTWKARDVLSFPATCVVIADFYQAKAIDAAEKKIKALGNKEGADISFRRWKSFPRKLMIELGAFPEEFFAEGAPLANRVMEICEGEAGTTSWNERTNPEHMGT